MLMNKKNNNEKLIKTSTFVNLIINAAASKYKKRQFLLLYDILLTLKLPY